MKTKINVCLAIALLCMFKMTFAQSDREKYLQVITERSDKIIAQLAIADSATYKKARAVVVQQYDNLNTHHEQREVKIKALKDKYAGQKEALDSKRSKLEAKEDAVLQKLHKQYIGRLSSLLSPQQVEKVKDGMTYGVLPLTYGAYQDMIPNLNGAQKEKILTYLTEARELAMDQPGSREKHQVFGKYKGRINNYLSSEGYDLKEEGKKWEERKAQKQAKK
ncbi:DUF3826 domain-containing protein [Sphingobacterium deserti]|uniref:DUF3826 domain-containing protein n=1 Tax=Sphingobacterium deserti TaxID=1229276 RepID=A0A0B8T1M6_9SPHI|nr:DUF3826 domain-containing protein [Sphingobacterium deserti]KGE14987.1 hypothetical protein DI53_1214 [Sphingobacterium deserti]